MSATATTGQPLLKGVAENYERTELIPFKLWRDTLPPSAPESAYEELHIANGYKCITEVWHASLQRGDRVRAWSRDWRLREFELYPWHRPSVDKPWTFWCIKLELEAVNP